MDFSRKLNIPQAQYLCHLPGVRFLYALKTNESRKYLLGTLKPRPHYSSQLTSSRLKSSNLASSLYSVVPIAFKLLLRLFEGGDLLRYSLNCHVSRTFLRICKSTHYSTYS